MTQDVLVTYVLKFLRVQPTPRSHDILFTLLYNFVPAFIFAPYLFFVGLEHDRILLMCMGVILFLIDLMHFLKAVNAIRNS
jgi:hypothetical protein